jgi:acyl-coenzyme A thioesterase PaaI-like protein
MTESTVPVVYGGPESLFRIGGLSVDGQVARGSMPTGEWLAGPDGGVALGSLGVLIDDVLGYATVAPVGGDMWSVSTEISLDVFPALQLPTSRLSVEARDVQFDELGCFATGTVTNDAGDLVAVCSQRGRYVPRTWSLDEPTDRRAAREASDVTSLIGARLSRTDDGALAELVAAPSAQNPLGILHGGISLCASDLAAALAIADGPPLRTASLRIVYTRAVPADSVVEYRATTRHRGRSLALVEVVGSVAGRACTWTQVTAHPA